MHNKSQQNELEPWQNIVNKHSFSAAQTLLGLIQNRPLLTNWPFSHLLGSCIISCFRTGPVHHFKVALLAIADSLCASRPWPGIFCLVAHQSKIACQAEVSVSWQDAPVTFQLERASVLQPSGQISENRSSRAEPSAIRKASLYQTPNAPLTLTSGTAGGSRRAAKGAAVRRNKVMFCWAWPNSVHLIGFKREKTLTLINLLNPLEHGESGGELWAEGGLAAP